MTTVRPPTKLRLDALSMGAIPRPWTWEASEIVVGGEVVKNCTGLGTADIGKPLGGSGSETALVTQEMVDYEEPSDWTYISVSALHDELLLTITRNDGDCGNRWIEYLANRALRDLPHIWIDVKPGGSLAFSWGSKGKTW